MYLEHTNELHFKERDFIDISDSYVDVKFQILCTAGSIIASDNLVLTNLLAYELWETVKLTEWSKRALSNLDE